MSVEHSEVSFLVSHQLKASLDEVRALLGTKGSSLTMAELIAEMASLSKERLLEKRFGRARLAKEAIAKDGLPSGSGSDVGEAVRRRSRHVPRAIQYAVWQRSDGKCTSCGSTHRLNFDHIQPFALGGDSGAENLRLLCSSCNLRRGITTFGVRTMHRD